MDANCAFKRQLSNRIVIQMNSNEEASRQQLERQFKLRKSDLRVPKGYYVYEVENIIQTLLIANEIFETGKVISAQPDWQGV